MVHDRRKPDRAPCAKVEPGFARIGATQQETGAPGSFPINALRAGGRGGDLPKIPGAPFEVPERFFESDACRTFLDLIPEYALFDAAPKILAARARAKGAADASARDFECPCDIDPDDGLPRCLGARENCRFAARPGDRDAAPGACASGPRMTAAKEAMAEAMSAFIKTDDAGRRRINQRLSQAAARRRRRRGMRKADSDETAFGRENDGLGESRGEDRAMGSREEGKDGRNGAGK
ncbi:MAG: hypothetical protein ACOZAA_07890 [Pseudomonadota bacterium]